MPLGRSNVSTICAPKARSSTPAFETHGLGHGAGLRFVASLTSGDEGEADAAVLPLVGSMRTVFCRDESSLVLGRSIMAKPMRSLTAVDGCWRFSSLATTRAWAPAVDAIEAARAGIADEVGNAAGDLHG